MGQFGEALRRERESRGVALESITNATKISSRHLVALEHEEFAQLPGGVFNKGIVRSYARVVGLDEEAWVGRFMLAYEASGAVTEDDASWIEFAKNVGNNREQEGRRPDMRLRWAGVVLLLMMLTALGWFVWHYVREKMSAANAAPRHAVACLSSAGDGPWLLG